MDAQFATQNPFALLTLIVAPAVLTNAMSVLALSTSNRFLRAGERLRVLAAELQVSTVEDERAWRLAHINRIERQAVLLLGALRAEYTALGSFVSASLISIIGAGLAAQRLNRSSEVMIVFALAVGVLGAVSLVFGCMNLLRATGLSMTNISEEASIIRRREAQRSNPGG